MTEIERIIASFNLPESVTAELFSWLSNPETVMRRKRDQKSYIINLERELDWTCKLNRQQSDELKIYHEKVTALESRIAELSSKAEENQRHEQAVEDYIKRFEDSNANLRTKLSDLQKQHAELLIDYCRLCRKDEEADEREKKLAAEAEEWELKADALKEDYETAESEKNFFESKWKELKVLHTNQAKIIADQDKLLAVSAKKIRQLETMITKYNEMESLYDQLFAKYKEI